MVQEALGTAEWGSEVISRRCPNQFAARKDLDLPAAIRSAHPASRWSCTGVDGGGSRGVNGGVKSGRRAGRAILATVRLEVFNGNHIMHMRAGGYAYPVCERADSLDDLDHRSGWSELVGALQCTRVEEHSEVTREKREGGVPSVEVALLHGLRAGHSVRGEGTPVSQVCSQSFSIGSDIVQDREYAVTKEVWGVGA